MEIMLCVLKQKVFTFLVLLSVIIIAEGRGPIYLLEFRWHDTRIMNILMMNGTFFKQCVRDTTTLKGF